MSSEHCKVSKLFRWALYYQQVNCVSSGKYLLHQTWICLFQNNVCSLCLSISLLFLARGIVALIACCIKWSQMKTSCCSKYHELLGNFILTCLLVKNDLIWTITSYTCNTKRKVEIFFLFFYDNVFNSSIQVNIGKINLVENLDVYVCWNMRHIFFLLHAETDTLAYMRTHGTPSHPPSPPPPPLK